MKTPNFLKKLSSIFKKKKVAEEDTNHINNQNQENVRIIREPIQTDQVNPMHQADVIENVEEPVARKKKKNPLRKVTRYFSCIILSVSTFGQMIIGHFVPRRTGDRAADAVEAAGHNLAIIAHDVNDIQEDQDFYEARAALERSARYPYIEGWARYLAETANTIIAFANRCTQYVATGKIPISMHDFIIGVQVMLLLGSFIGIKTSESTTSMIQSLTISAAASRVAQHYYPTTVVVSELSNHFFDFLSDRLIRPIIYFNVDILEYMLDKTLYGPTIVAQENLRENPINNQGNNEVWAERVANDHENRPLLCLI